SFDDLIASMTIPREASIITSRLLALKPNFIDTVPHTTLLSLACFYETGSDLILQNEKLAAQLFEKVYDLKSPDSFTYSQLKGLLKSLYDHILRGSSYCFNLFNIIFDDLITRRTFSSQESEMLCNHAKDIFLYFQSRPANFHEVFYRRNRNRI